MNLFDDSQSASGGSWAYDNAETVEDLLDALWEERRSPSSFRGVALAVASVLTRHRAGLTRDLSRPGRPAAAQAELLLRKLIATTVEGAAPVTLVFDGGTPPDEERAFIQGDGRTGRLTHIIFALSSDLNKPAAPHDQAARVWLLTEGDISALGQPEWAAEEIPANVRALFVPPPSELLLPETTEEVPAE